MKSHGMCQTRFYQTWVNMKQRCSNPKSHVFHRYGALGITVCPEWENFIQFKEDMHESYLQHVEEFGEKATTIERTDNKKGYSKGNCRWATMKEQNDNKSSIINLIFEGKTMNIVAWARTLGICRSTIHHRLERHLPLERVLTSVLERKRRKKKELSSIRGNDLAQ